ncbi:DUF4262 domain-containing protein [Actinokineospora globicatena]|uniref:DUF4262 domain-containing protein n=1 Tax=Actinokineospora globicatena TaxID=103729 RepID=UPI0020A5DB67|nr:DUF4262 domain-containing protein [Actinokineospora globicatena]MCP2304745.1 protein of unknown function (DUF4262) [Actinokineospora globicatena]
MSCRCQLCGGERDESFSGVLGAVERLGWGVVGVAGARFDIAHTVGLWHSSGVPEVAMFGLGGEDMLEWLGRCVRRGLDQGWPEAGVAFGGVIDGAETRLRVMDGSWFGGLFGAARHFYGEVVPVSQLVWPDDAGRWPWDDDAAADVRESQPRGWAPVAEQPAGSWRLIGELGADYPFPVSPDALALTSRSIVDGARSPVLVARGEGLYDVLDERGYQAEDLTLAHLGDITTRHPGLTGAAYLGDDEAALVADGTWTRVPRTPEQLEASVTAWQRVSTA